MNEKRLRDNDVIVSKPIHTATGERHYELTIKRGSKSKFLKARKSKLGEAPLIGLADFETVVVDNTHYVFAAGFRLLERDAPTKTKVFYASGEYKHKGVKKESNRVISAFMEFVLHLHSIKAKKNQRLYIYFHNLSGFDGVFISRWLFDNIPDRHKSVKFLEKEGRLYFIDCFSKIRFLDSLNIANSSLDSLGWELKNIRKMNIDYDGLMGTPESYMLNKESISRYLIRDVDILHDVVKELEHTYRTDFKLDITKNITAASRSFQHYLEFYHSESNEIEKPPRWKYDYINAAFYGGLVSVNKPSLENAHVYDINSLYPYIMSTRDMPLGQGGIYRDISWVFVEKSGMLGFVNCEVHTDTPGLPYRRDKGDVICTPTGSFSGTWFTEELKFHASRGVAITKVHSAVLYPGRGVIFKEYVNKLYSMRLTAKKANKNSLSLALKLLMNSLFGVFGMKNQFYKRLFVENMSTDKISRMKMLYDSVIYHKDVNIMCISWNNEQLKNNKIALIRKKVDFATDKETLDDLLSYAKGTRFDDLSRGVQIAAAITAYARIKLIKDMDEVGETPAYFDTDSLVTTKPLPEHLLETKSKELGRYKLENRARVAIFLAPKTYLLLGLVDHETHQPIACDKENPTIGRPASCKGCKKALKGIPKEYVKEHISCHDLVRIFDDMQSIEKGEISPPTHVFKKTFLKSLKDLTINTKPNWEHSLLLKSDKFKREYDHNGRWVGCLHPRMECDNGETFLVGFGCGKM